MSQREKERKDSAICTKTVDLCMCQGSSNFIWHNKGNHGLHQLIIHFNITTEGFESYQHRERKIFEEIEMLIVLT